MAKMTKTAGKHDSSDEADDRRIHELSSDVANAVRGAADVFERELSSSLAGARTLQRQLFDDHRVRDEDFTAVTGRFRETAHQTITAFSDRLADQSADGNKDLAHRFSRDAQDAFDAFMDLVDRAPSLINFLAKSAENLSQRVNSTTPAPGTGEDQDTGHK
ncbi:hypothetical protein ACLMAL_36015 (plasmid) [Nocardia sp. CWNU-33]|uniref:hypothetical protein n=1 Tax=Nocardia sp. CWNU-33 TaxID=3392117 RepID=UPI00398E36A5